MELIAQADGSRRHRLHQRLDGILVQVGDFATSADEDNLSLSFRPFNLLLQAGKKMTNRDDSGIRQPVHVIFGHVLRCVIVRIPVSQILVFGQNDNVKTEFQHSLARVVLKLGHSFGQLGLFLAKQGSGPFGNHGFARV